MPLDPIRVADTRGWLTKARRDIRGAEVDLAATPPLLDDVMFHCQQAVEKALKGFLFWHDQPFRKTHDLVEIGSQVFAIDTTLAPLVKRAEPLTEYAWLLRYPGEAAEPTPDEASAALALAREVVAAVFTRLPPDVRS